jgi:nucleotide-binding universal stress UspA family protein
MRAYVCCTVMGSDAEQVVRNAPMPVLLVRAPGR